MADFTIAVALQIGFNAETLAAINALASVLGRIPPTPASAASPVQSDAPRDRGAVTDTSLLEPAEGPSRAAGETHAGRSPKPPRAFSGWLTTERKELLRELWPSMATPAKIREELEKQSGPEIPPSRVIRDAAKWMKLRRPEALLPSGIRAHRATLAERKAALQPSESDFPPLPATEMVKSVTDLTTTVTSEAAAVAPPPHGRIDMIRRIAASLPNKPNPPPAAPKGTPIEAGQEAIRQWAAQRGVTMGAFDLTAVNAKAAAIGHPGFILKTPMRAARPSV